jgi:putative restriction endonuclease
MWHALGNPDAVTPAQIRELGLHRGQQGVFRDLGATAALSADGAGITVGVLHTGSVYADDLTDDGVIYHYPSTARGVRDANEIEATKNCQRLGLPLFVVITPSPAAPVRVVRLGWVVDYDDASGLFLIVFGETAPRNEPTMQEFVLQIPHRDQRPTATTARPGQLRFRFDVFKRYGPQCALCTVTHMDLLEAAHLCPVADDGSDDPRNGLVLCRNHHRAMDKGLVAIEPSTLAVRVGSAFSPEALGVTRESLAHLPATPHQNALRWLWSLQSGRTHAAQ